MIKENFNITPDTGSGNGKIKVVVPPNSTGKSKKMLYLM